MTSIRRGFRLALFLLFLLAPPLPAETEPPLKGGEIITNEPSPDSPAPADSTGPAAMIRAIEQRKSELDKRAKELDLKEERIRLMEQEVSQMLKKSTQVREALEQKEAKQKQIEEKQVGRLAKMYETMSPQEAAARIEQMNESLALTLLAKIKEKSAAQILTGLSPTKAARFTEKLAKNPL